MSQQHYGLSAETRAGLEAIARKHRFKFERLQEPGRGSKPLCAARFDCYAYLSEERGWSTPQIAKLFNRDHSTVVYWLDRKGTRARQLKTPDQRRVA